MGSNTDNKQERQILKSTFIMGGASVINSLLGMIRTKIIALMLGPSGVGLIGIYLNITSLVSTFSEMGIGESGVRQIAGAFSSGGDATVSNQILTIRRAALLSGLAGLILLLVFSDRVSRLTFGSADHALDISLLSITVFLTAVSAGQTALIQGMRHIGDLAKVSIISAFFGTLLSVPVIYFFGERGIVCYLLVVSATALLASWWYSGKIRIPPSETTWKESLIRAKPLLKLGMALMLGSLMTVGTQYLLRVFIIRLDGMNAAGAFQASSTLSLVYVGIILNAMLTDFYPRLSAAARDQQQCTFLINKQVQMGLLLAIPGILAIMTFAPLLVILFYSAAFTQAIEILRWQILGVSLQVINWPMGFMLRAQGNGRLFFRTELFANACYLGLAWLGLKVFGLPGIGMAFFGMNVLYGMIILFILKKSYDFSFQPNNIRLVVAFGIAIGTVFATPWFLPIVFHLLVNSVVTAAVALYSLITLNNMTDSEMIPGFFLKLKARFSPT